MSQSGGRGYGGRGGGGSTGGRGGFGGGRGGGHNQAVGTPIQSPLSTPYLASKIKGVPLASGWQTPEGGVSLPPKGQGQGTVSKKKIPITVNHVSCNVVLPRTCFYQYDVDITVEKVKKVALEKKDSTVPPTKEMGSLDLKRERPHGFTPPHGGHAHAGETKIDVPNPKLWKKVVSRLVVTLEHEEQIKLKIATDYSKALYTTRPLHLRDIVHNHNYVIEAQELADDTERTDERFLIKVKQSATITTDDARDLIPNLRAACVAGKPLPGNLTDIERVLNVALKTESSQNFISVGRSSFFSPPTATDFGFKMGGGVVSLTGFSLIYTMGWKSFINVDTANSVFVMGSTVNSILEDLGFRNPFDVTTWSDLEFKMATELLRNILISYKTGRNPNPAFRRVRELRRKPARECLFVDDQQKQTNVEQYYVETQKRKLQYPKGLCLLLGKSAIVPAEFCTVTSGQSYTGKLTDTQTSTMIKNTAKPPEERKRAIQNAVARSNFGLDPVLKEFGMTAGKELHKMEARVLDTPTLIYKDRKGTNQFVGHKPGPDGVWNQPQGTSFYTPGNKGQPTSWTVLEITNRPNNSTPRPEQQAALRHFVDSMIAEGMRMGINLGDAGAVMENYKMYPARDLDSIHTFLDPYVGKYKFILVVLPSKDTLAYSMIKARTELKGYMAQKPGQETVGDGLLTQCVQFSNVQGCRPAVVENIIRKLNAKLGGVNHIVKISNVDIFEVPVLLIGADVTHPQAGSDYPSIASVTASIGRTGAVYAMSCKAQRKASCGAAEVIEDFGDIMFRFMVMYVKQTGHKPRKIYVSRDGVGDGQFQEVLQKEMMAIRSACEKMYPKVYEHARGDIALGETSGTSYEPKITFLAVQKRHKTRFFPDNPYDGVGKVHKNVPPGTVVDSDIVNPRTRDFYLVSHTGIQGTSKPTRYQVLWDDNNFSMDELQTLSYHLCYAYSRCNRSVSYPAPTYYAHLACSRAKTYVTSFPESDLRDLATLNKKMVRHSAFTQGDLKMHFI